MAALSSPGKVKIIDRPNIVSESSVSSKEFSELFSEELKKAVAFSEEKIQQRSRRRSQFSSSRFPCRKNSQTLAGIAFHAAGKLGNHFPAASEFAGKLFQQRMSDSHSLLEFSAFRPSPSSRGRAQ